MRWATLAFACALIAGCGGGSASDIVNLLWNPSPTPTCAQEPNYPEGCVTSYFIFRDGKKVATSTSTSYKDKATKGLHSWYVTAISKIGLQSKPSSSSTAIVP
jgi:hypothetical protein